MPRPQRAARDRGNARAKASVPETRRRDVAEATARTTDCGSPFSPAREVSYGSRKSRSRKSKPRLLAAARCPTRCSCFSPASPGTAGSSRTSTPAGSSWCRGGWRRASGSTATSASTTDRWRPTSAAAVRPRCRALATGAGRARGRCRAAPRRGARRLARRLPAPGAPRWRLAAVVAVAFFLRPGGCHLFPFSLDTAIAVTALTWALVAASRRRPRARTTWRRRWPARRAPLAARAGTGRRRDPGRSPLGASRSGCSACVLFLGGAGGARHAPVSPRASPCRDSSREGWLAFIDPPEAFRNVYASYAGLDRLGAAAWPSSRSPPSSSSCSPRLLCAASALAAPASAGAAPAASARSRGGPLTVLAAVSRLRRPQASLAERFRSVPPLVRVVPPLLVAGRGLRGSCGACWAGEPRGALSRRARRGSLARRRSSPRACSSRPATSGPTAPSSCRCPRALRAPGSFGSPTAPPPAIGRASCRA